MISNHRAQRRRVLRGAFAFSVLALTAALPLGSAEAARADDAKAFIERVAERAISLAADGNASHADREKRFRELLRDSVDYERIASFTLGPYRRRASDTQMQTFIGLLEDNVVLTYLRRFSEYQGQQVKVVDSREGRNDSVEVTTNIVAPGSSAQPFQARWLVQGNGGSLRIVDVTLESIRMTVTYRDDFVDVITRANGDIDALLAEMRTRNQRLAAQQ